jgi:hypothetical protein
MVPHTRRQEKIQIEKFERFRLLPVELRSQIWCAIGEDVRVIRVGWRSTLEF